MKISINKLFVLVLILLCCMLSSCINNSFFSNSLLEEAFISDIKKPENAEGMHLYNSIRLKYNSTIEDYMNYVEYVYDYLKDKDFKYLGYTGDKLDSEDKASLAPRYTYEFIQGIDLSSHLIDSKTYTGGLEYRCYEFVYGNNINSETILTDCVSLTIIYDATKEYNVEIRINTFYKQIQGDIYYIDGSSFKYNIHLETTEYLFDKNVQKTAPKDKTIYLKILPVYDNKIKVYINEIEIPKNYHQFSNEYILYHFVMETNDVYITFEIIE